MWPLLGNFTIVPAMACPFFGLLKRGRLQFGGRAPVPKGSSELPRAPPWARHPGRLYLAALPRPRSHPADPPFAPPAARSREGTTGGGVMRTVRIRRASALSTVKV